MEPEGCSTASTPFGTNLHVPRCSHAYLPLLHESPDGEPETVREGEVILEDEAGVHAGMRMGPLVRRKPRNDPDGDRDEDVCEENVEPDFQGQRIHEGEELRRTRTNGIMCLSGHVRLLCMGENVCKSILRIYSVAE